MRYWVAEHHGFPMLACTSPEALIPVLASATTRIRVGSGGVMLPHYSPFKVAETFSLISGLFPDRVDLGIGRAAGTDAVTTFALQRDRRHAAPDDFPEQLGELLAYLRDGLAPEHAFAHLTALPGAPAFPDVWLLGSSAQSGVWAAEAGLPYAFADFISPTGAGISKGYRDAFKPSASRLEPYVIVALSVVCADTDEDAARIASSARMAFVLRNQGQFIQVPPVERAVQFFADHGAAAAAVARRRRTVVGSPSTVREGVQAVVSEYGADEAMIVTITHDHRDRRRSYELIVEAFS